MRTGNTYCLGVTGVIGSGKSTLCRFLQARHGWHWIDADKITRELYQHEAPGYKKIREYFGEYFVGKNGVNRGRLRKLVLKSPQKIWILNKLMHPLVCNEVNKKIVQLKRLSNDLRICIEAIYFEPSDLGRFVDAIIKVEASEQNIVRRLKLRGLAHSDIATLYKFQHRHLPPTQENITLAIQNNGTERAFLERARRIIEGHAEKQIFVAKFCHFVRKF